MPRKTPKAQKYDEKYVDMSLSDILNMTNLEVQKLNKTEMNYVLKNYIKYAQERTNDMRRRHWDDSSAGEVAKQNNYYKNWKPEKNLNDMRNQFKDISKLFNNPLSDRDTYHEWKNELRNEFINHVGRYVKLSNNREYFWYDRPIYKKDSKGNNTKEIERFVRTRQRITKKFVRNFFDFYERAKEINGATQIFEGVDRGTNPFFANILFYFTNTGGNVTFTNVEKYIDVKSKEKNMSKSKLLDILLTGNIK